MHVHLASALGALIHYLTDSNQINIQAIYRKLGYFGCSLILVYLVPLVKVPKLNTQKSAIVNSNEPMQKYKEQL